MVALLVLAALLVGLVLGIIVDRRLMPRRERARRRARGEFVDLRRRAA